MHAFVVLIFVAVAFLPATILLYIARSVWIANPSPGMAKWRIATFKWGSICAPLSMALLAPGAGHYLWTYGPPNWFLTVTNWFGLLLWAFSFGAAFVGRGSTRWLLCSWAILAMLGLLVIYLTYP
jgi:hypothetical protein